MSSQVKIEEVIHEGKVYLPPCQVACPLKEDIQHSHALISLLPPDIGEAKDQIINIADEIYEKNPLMPVASYVCGLCEKECNYKDQTGAIRRKLLVRFLSDYYLPYLKTKPELAPPTKEKIAAVGGGPGSLMCAYVLAKKGYRVTILERNPKLGGALRLIPRYRLPEAVLDTTLDNLVRIAHIEVETGTGAGSDGKTLDELKREDYKAIFIATGTPLPRPLTFGRGQVPGADLEGVMFGLDLLSDMGQKEVSPQLFKGKKVIVVGGGNVAFDVARTARRLAGEVSLVCLECEDKSLKDGIPADVEEIEGSGEEGIKITYSRGVEEIVGKDGKFAKIKCPRCTSVFDESGFNPQFDRSDVIWLEGDVLLVTIGQAPERAFLQQEGLLNEKGRLDVNQVTLMSNLKPGVFIGGDVKRVGFAAEAMRDGATAADSIERWLKGEDLIAGREKEYEDAPIPSRGDWKPQPEFVWTKAAKRLNFEPFEKGFDLKEAMEESRRCLCCGPCKSCKGCVVMELQPEIPEIEVDQDICSGCGACVTVCSYDATSLEKTDKGLTSVIDDDRCKRCGLCVTACPAGARSIKDNLEETLAAAYAIIRQ